VIVFPAEPRPKVSIVVVAWREAPFLLPCLASVSENVTGAPYEVLIVLNEPSPVLTEKVQREVTGARVLPFRTNLGFGGAVNAAAQAAAGQYLLLLNDDSVVERGWLESLVDTAERRPAAGMVGSTYLHPDGSLQEAGSVLWRAGATSAFSTEAGEAASWRFERQVDYCSGGSLLVRKDVWDQLAGFDDRYYPAYFEDIDLALRARELGWEVWYQPLSILRHVRSGSSGRLHQFLYERSRQQFLERWGHRLEEMQARGDFERAAWRAMGRPTRVLILDDHLPDRGIGAGYGRMRDTVEALASDPGIHLAVHPTVEARMDPAQLAQLGVRVVTDLESHLATEGVGYDVVVVSRPNNFAEFHDLLRKRLPDAKVVYDAEALFYRRLEAQLEHLTSGDGAPVGEAGAVEALASELDEARRREQWIFGAADAVVCISEEEAALVRRDAAGPVHVIEAWLATPSPTVAPFEERADIGLVAGWAAGPGSPNAEGLLWFAHEVLPKVRAALPGCRLRVTGANPPADVSWLAGRSVEFVGFVHDLSLFYEQIRVAISPTPYGAGVKLKTVEAIQHGVPVVATTDAVGGIDPDLRRAVWATDDPAEFAGAIVAFYRDPDVWAAYRQRELAVGEAGRSSRPNSSRWIELIRDTVGATDDRETAHNRGDT
jgi:GT2 family glycosyltransferase/glycosyltransferase involved in cell wall biosynthesis